MIRHRSGSPGIVRPAALALVGLMAIVLAACGGDGKKLPAQEYISKADAICKRENAKRPRPARGQATAQDAERAADFRESLRKKLGELKPPSALANKVAQYDALTKQIVSGVRNEGKLLGRKDFRGTLRSELEVSQLVNRRSKLATQIGFKVCSQLAGSTTPLGTDASIVQRADAACRQADLKGYELLPANTGDLAGYAKASDSALQVQRSALTQIEALKPPARDRAAFDAFLKVFRQRVDLTAQQGAAARRNDRKRFIEVSQQDVGLSQSEGRPATQLGFEVCGQLGPNGV
jgi:hypothetical protein